MGRPNSAPLPPSVGRASEMSTVRQHASQASQGVTQFVLIEGALGVGKSHLIRLVESALKDFNQVRLTLVQEDLQRPGFVGSYLLDTHLTSSSTSAAELVRSGYLALQRIESPTLIVLENFEWADPLSAEAAWRLLRETQGHPVLVLMSMGPHDRPDLERLRDFAHGHTQAAHIHLDNFSTNTLREVVEEISGLPVSERSAEQIHQETGGLPALVREVAQWLKQTPPYPGRSITHALTALRRSLRHPGHPVSHRILEHMGRLSEPARRTLELVSVGDRSQIDDQLRAMLHQEAAALNELISHGIIAYDHDTYNYRFRDASWRSVVLSTMRRERRAALHADLASGTDEAANVHHLFEAALLQHSPADFAAVAARGAELAHSLLQQGERHRAFEVLRRAIIIDTAKPQLKLFVRLALERQQIRRLGDVDLEPTYRALPPGTYRAALLALVSLTRGDLEAAVRQLQELDDDHLIQPDDVVLFAHAVAECSRHYIRHGGEQLPPHLFASALHGLNRQTAEQGEQPDPNSRNEDELVNILRAWRGLCAGDAAESLDVQDSRDISLRAVVAARKRQAGKVHEAFDELQLLAQQCNVTDHDGVTFARVHFALSLFYAGRWDEADRAARAAAERGLEVGESPDGLMAYAAAALVPSAREHDTATELLAHLASPTESMRSSAVRGTASFAHSWASLAGYERQHTDKFTRTLTLGTFPWSVTGLLPAVLFTRAVEPERRQYVLPALLDLVSNRDIPGTEELRRYVAAYISGMMEKEPSTRLIQLMDALRHLDLLTPGGTLIEPQRCGLRIFRALLVMDIGELYASHAAEMAELRGDIKGLVAWAEDVFALCGADSLAQKGRRIYTQIQDSGNGRSTNGRVDQRLDAQLFSLLTTREREVTAMIGRGLKNRQIAETLVLSVRTVETHVRNILTKLESPNRRALQRQLVDLAERQPAER